MLYITRNKYVGVWIVHSHVNNENYTSLQDIELFREVHIAGDNFKNNGRRM